MRVSEIETAGGLERLWPDWCALWARVPHAGPFQHPDWLLPWWRHIGGGELLVLAMSGGADLVGLAPFYIHSDPAAGTRQLTLLGNGISDSCDVLFDPSHAGVKAAMAERLFAARARWNTCDLRDLPARSPLIPIMRDRADATVVDDEPCVVVDLRNWATAGKSPLPASLRADLRRRRRRAEELGSVRLEFVGEEDLAPALETLVGLHALRWHARGERGALDAGNVIAFHQEVADRFARRQWLRLCRLSIGERAAAVTYGFSVKRRAYFYIGGFDPAYARLGVGGLILHEIIRRAAAEGGQEFDFLRGEEDYKLRWGGQARAQYRATWPAAT